MNTLFRGWSAPENLSEQKLIAILKITKIWMIQDGIKFAVYYLEKKNLSSSRKLQLAQQFSILSWIQPAIVELLDASILQMEDPDIAQIGIQAFTIIVKAKESLEHQRRLYAWYPPKLPENTILAVSCSPAMHHCCLKIWKEGWLKYFPQRLLHPTTPLPLHSILTHVMLLDLPDINPGCMEQWIDYLKSSDFLLYYSKVVDRVVTRIADECCAYDVVT